MRLAWPLALIGLVVPLGLLGAYLWIRRRRRKFAVTFASLSLIRDAQPDRSRWRLLVPAALLLAAIVSLVGAMAPPQVVRSTARGVTSVTSALIGSRSVWSLDAA